jgi:hypothetical protein
VQLPDVWQGGIHCGYPALQLSTKRLDTALGEYRGGPPPLTGVWGCPPESKTSLGGRVGRTTHLIVCRTRQFIIRLGPRLNRDLGPLARPG